MGLTIQYSGCFNKEASLSEMISEVKDIAELYKWNYTIFKTPFQDELLGKESYNQKIYGIQFTPPLIEPISLCFLSNGRMSSPFNLQFFGKPNTNEEDPSLYLLFIKPHYAGYEMHIIIVHLLKYLSKKYFSEFSIVDQSNYWNTEDEEALKNKYLQNEILTDKLEFGLKHFPILTNESIEDYIVRLLDKINKRKI